MEIKKPKIEIKELNYIRVLSDDGINSSEIDKIVGGRISGRAGISPGRRRKWW